MSKRSEYRRLFLAVTNILNIIGLWFVGLKVQYYFDKLQSGEMSIVPLLPAVVMLAVIIVYGLLWYLSAEIEYGFFARYLSEFAPDAPREAVIAAIVVPMVLSVMAFCADTPSVFCGMFAVYIVVNVAVRHVMRRHSYETLTRARGKVPDEVEAKFARMYLDRPFQLLNGLLLVAATVAVLLVLFADRIFDLGVLRLDGNLAAYIMIWLGLGVTEAIVWQWRLPFYRSMSALD